MLANQGITTIQASLTGMQVLSDCAQDADGRNLR